MLIDLHAHTSGISRCCRIPAPEVLRRAKENGIDGIVLTNHYQKCYVENDDALAFAKKYIAEYEYTRQCGTECGYPVLFGIEVSTEPYPNVHILIYGVHPDFCLAYPDMYEYDLETLCRIVHENGGTLIQAHPFRNGTHVLDTRYLDGVEINCHPLYQTSCADQVTAAAKESGLILTCGGDYHADTYRPRCGVEIPDAYADTIAIGTYLRTTDTIRLRVQEPNTESYYETDYIRTNPQK